MYYTNHRSFNLALVHSTQNLNTQNHTQQISNTQNQQNSQIQQNSQNPATQNPQNHQFSNHSVSSTSSSHNSMSNQIEASQIVATLQIKTAHGRDRAGLGLQIRGGKPAKITEVAKNKDAWNAGIRVGDVIIKVNGQPASDLDHKEVIQKIKSNKERVVLTLLRYNVMPDQNTSNPALNNSNSSGFSTPRKFTGSTNSLNTSQDLNPFEQDNNSPSDPNNNTSSSAIKKRRDQVLKMGDSAYQHLNNALLRDTPGRRGVNSSEHVVSMPENALPRSKPQKTSKRQMKKDELELDKFKLTESINNSKKQFEETGDMKINKEIRDFQKKLNEVKRELHEINQLPPETIQEEDETVYSKTLPGGGAKSGGFYTPPSSMMFQDDVGPENAFYDDNEFNQENNYNSPEVQEAHMSPSEVTNMTGLVIDENNPENGQFRQPLNSTSSTLVPSTVRSKMYVCRGLEIEKCWKSE